MWIRRNISRLVIVLGALMVSGLTLIGPASAQKDGALTGRAGATPSGDVVRQAMPATELKLQEFTPWLVQKPKGPGEAKGVVYFVGGASRGAPLTSGKATPYLLKTMSEGGWDIIGVRLPREEFEGKPITLDSLVPQGAALVE